MTLPPPPLAPEAALRRLALTVSRRLDGLLQGEHPGLVPGAGSEPAEARPHVVGDDARRIDWAVTARTGEPHVRRTIADRERETTVVLDLSASMAFGTRRSEKRDLALAVAVGVLHLTSGHGDRVGAVVVDSAGVRRLPARSGRTGALTIQHVLATTARSAEGAGPSLGSALQSLVFPPRRRGLVVVVSDLLDAGTTDARTIDAGTIEGGPSWLRPLGLLARRHDVVVAEVIDPRELELPAVGALRLVDPESGRLLDVHVTRSVATKYAAAAAARRDRHRGLVRSVGAGHVVLRTDRDWLLDLARYLARRRHLPAVVRPATTVLPSGSPGRDRP